MFDACPTDDVLDRLLANGLKEAEEQELESHLVHCEACQQRLELKTRLSHFVHPFASPDGGNGGSPSQSGGLLARLAESSTPAPLDVMLKERGKKRPSETSIRRLSSSTISASGRFVRRQIWVWPLVAALLLGGLGWWVSWSVESAMRQQRIHELTTVLNADVAALRQWMDNQRAMAELVAADETIRPLVQELLAQSDGTGKDRSVLMQTPAQSAIRARLAEPLRRGGFTGFLLTSPDAVALSADEDSPVGVELSGYRREFFRAICHDGAAVSKPFPSPLLLADEQGERRADQPCMYAAAPIQDEQGRPIAALGLRIRPEDQFTRILQVAQSGETGETYAFDRDGVLLSQSRFDDELKQIGLLVDRPHSRSILNVELRDPGVNMVRGERPTIRRDDQPLTRMASDAIQGKDGHDVDGYRDYRGVPVVGAWQWLDEYSFGVATEVDVDEAFAPAYFLRRTFAVLMGVLVAAAVGIFLAMLLLARQRRQLHAAAAAKQFGQYTLGEKLGAGGMGAVYKAQHAHLRRPTAIKLLNPETISNSTLARFEREVQLTSELTHSNTVAIYDYGNTPEGVFYYAMEYLEGVNLDELVRRYGPLPEARALYILRQVCASLAEAHAAGMVHRDVKPPNIFLTVRGGQHDFVKVLDFGLAKVVNDNSDVSLTATNTVAGSPLYVSPEAVMRPEQIDARADVYGIGAVGYFLLTGSPVFTGATAAYICTMHVRATPQAPSERLGRPISPELESLLLRCLAKSPADRPNNAGKLLQLLETCAISGSWSAVEAARWWADCEHEHSAATRIFSAGDTPRANMQPDVGEFQCDGNPVPQCEPAP